MPLVTFNLNGFKLVRNVSVRTPTIRVAILGDMDISPLDDTGKFENIESINIEFQRVGVDEYRADIVSVLRELQKGGK